MTIVEFNSNDDDYKRNTAQIKKCLKENTILIAHAVWCPHCVVMKQDWELVKRDIGPKIHIIEIESSNLERIKQNDTALFKKLFKDDRVMFPTIKMYKNNKASMYEKERTFPVMKEHFKKHFSKTKPKTVKKTPKKITTPLKGGDNVKKTGQITTKDTKVLRRIQTDLNKFVQDLVQRQNYNK